MSTKSLEDKKFWKSCTEFKDGQTFEQYYEDVIRCLTLSDWHYTPEQASRFAEHERAFIKEEYDAGMCVFDTAMEVGFGGG